MNKQQKIERLKSLGITDDLGGKTVAQLDALLAENDPSASKSDQENDDDAAPVGDDPRTGKKLEVRIEVSAEPGGKDPVFASVNGFNFQAKRGVWIELDEGFVRHLENTTFEDVTNVLDASGKPTGEIDITPRSRFQVTRKRN